MSKTWKIGLVGAGHGLINPQVHVNQWLNSDLRKDRIRKWAKLKKLKLKIRLL